MPSHLALFSNARCSCAAASSIGQIVTDRKICGGCLLQCARDVDATRRGLFDNQPMRTMMERIVAIKKLGKMLGKGFGYRVDPKAPTADERAEARERAKTLNEEFNAAGKAEAARKDALLNGDAEFQRLRAEVLRLR